jgi:hypothetical protein
MNFEIIQIFKMVGLTYVLLVSTEYIQVMDRDLFVVMVK